MIAGDIKKFIETNINLIEDYKIKELLYIAYREIRSNLFVQELMETLDSAGVVSEKHFKDVASDLLMTLFVDFLQRNKDTRREFGLKLFINLINNSFGLSYEEILQILTDKQLLLSIKISEYRNLQDYRIEYYG